MTLVEEAMKENNLALRVLESQERTLSLLYTLISYAQENMLSFRQQHLLYLTTALTFQMESLRVSMETWDSKCKEVVKHLQTALGYLILTIGKYAPDYETRLTALRLINEENPQTETAKNAVKTADETLNRIISKVAGKGLFHMPSGIHIPNVAY
ncbi:unnamed protein product [Nippostrongylus brasiliensis]|uniref:DUF4423 domain-containing protein n=1 Tax=Nippostrongylus brasiliensis TaxID=27835 RepID=A0A0N4Y865_NIPBR|nr:unnamed protein product [Nippostrongylus brasiliensis]